MKTSLNNHNKTLKKVLFLGLGFFAILSKGSAPSDRIFNVSKQISVGFWSATMELSQDVERAVLSKAQQICDEQNLKARKLSEFLTSEFYEGHGFYQVISSAHFLCE